MKPGMRSTPPDYDGGRHEAEHPADPTASKIPRRPGIADGGGQVPSHASSARHSRVAPWLRSTPRPRNWYLPYNLGHRLRWRHWPVWRATYGACGYYLTECEHCGRWC